AELEKQARKQQRACYQKEAEVDEVFAKVRCASRGFQTFKPDRIDRETVGDRIERRTQTLLERFKICRGVFARRPDESQRRQLAVARLPELLPRLERNESLRRGSILMPVLFVLRSNALEVDRKRRVPV